MTVEAIKAAVRSAAPRTRDPVPPVSERPSTPMDCDPLAALIKFAVTTEQVDQMECTHMMWRSLIAASHMQGWVGPPGSAKTAVAKLAAGELSSDGYRVMFFQEDAPAGDLPGLFAHATEHGYVMLNSTLSGSSTEDQVRTLRQMSKAGVSLARCVFFFDTLKKYVDLMSKGGARAFFKLMRALTQLGATIILLGHTNKHRGLDGKLIFEGVGDVRNDVDELIYFDATKDPRGIVTVTLQPDKVRCKAQGATFELDTNSMQIRPLDRVVDVAGILERQRRQAVDADLIAAIQVALGAGGLKFVELRDRVLDATGKSRDAITRVIERYASLDAADTDALWFETRLRVNNTRHISLKPEKGVE